MASDGNDLTDQLRAMERGEATPWTQYRPGPWWYPSLYGVIGALLVLTIGLLDGLASAIALPCVIVGSWIVTFCNPHHQPLKPSGSMPREFWRSIVLYLLGAVGVFVLVWMVATQIGVWPAAGTAFLLTWALVAWSESMNARAAQRLQDRLP